MVGSWIDGLDQNGLNYRVAGQVISDIKAQGYAMGLLIDDVQVDNTATAGDAYGIRIDNIVVDGTNYNQASYGIFIGDVLNTNGAGTDRWGVYQSGNANNYLRGNLSIGSSSEATSDTTGAFRCEGGISCEKNAHVGGAITADAQPLLNRYNNAVQVLTASPNLQIISFNSATDTAIGITGATTTFTVPSNGTYMVIASVYFAVYATSFNAVTAIYKNSIIYQEVYTRGDTASTVTGVVNAIMVLTASDTIEVYASHSTTNALGTGSTVASAANRIQITKLH